MQAGSMPACIFIVLERPDVFAGIVPPGMAESCVRCQKPRETAYFLWFLRLFGRMRRYRPYRRHIFNFIPDGVKHEEPLYYDHDH
ncbi:hypothetical protein RS75_21810 [Rhizobium nepotum 39/7]|uniref:Uncharacterized protein n=1 Tax=Rhizobium nepotum 39/7 TaxID=1368418 RepID=A0ABR5CLD2_9HYPH|nr:hypothetical protein RS75_21810 [Rhizobium nepotum 39/7]